MRVVVAAADTFVVVVVGHPYKLHRRRSLTSTRTIFFSERVVDVWNIACRHLDFTSLSKFHRSILKVNLYSFVKRF